MNLKNDFSLCQLVTSSIRGLYLQLVIHPHGTERDCDGDKEEEVAGGKRNLDSADGEEDRDADSEAGAKVAGELRIQSCMSTSGKELDGLTNETRRFQGVISQRREAGRN